MKRLDIQGVEIDNIEFVRYVPDLEVLQIDNFLAVVIHVLPHGHTDD